MINRKQFYGIFSIIILIFIAAVFFSNSGPESVQGDSLQYKNGVLYTKAGEKYTGKVTESEGYKAKINGVQISEGFVTVKKGLMNGKFEFISFSEFWHGAEVKGKEQKATEGQLLAQAEPEDLIKLIADRCNLLTGQEFGTGIYQQDPEIKPHGRLAWLVIVGSGAALDISVMPRIIK